MSLAHALAFHLFSPPRDEPIPTGRYTSRETAPETAPAGIERPTHPIDTEESVLVTRIRAGDELAMRDIVRQYASSLTRFAYTIVHAHDLAEAIAYDVLSDVWVRREGLQSDRSLTAYLFTAVRRRAWDEMERAEVRMRYATRMQTEQTRAEETESAAWIAPSPESLLLDRDDAEAQAARVAVLRETIVQLPERRRVALHLRFEQGLSYPAMGEILGLSDKAAQQLVLRTIAALRKSLGV